MPRLTQKQQTELEELEWIKGRTFHPTAVEQYFQFSSMGRRPKNPHADYVWLVWAQKYLNLQITQWKEDLLQRFIFKVEIRESGCPPSVWEKIKDAPTGEPDAEEMAWIRRTICSR